MEVVVVIVVVAVALAFVVLTAVAVRSRRGVDLEPPAPGVAVDSRDRAVADQVQADVARQVEEAFQTALPEDATSPVEVAPGEVVEAQPVPDLRVLPEPEAPAPPEAPPRPSFRQRMGRARSLLSGYVGSVLSRTSIDEEAFDEIEEALIRADVGVATAQTLLDSLRQRVKAESLGTPEELVAALKAQLKEDLSEGDHALHLEAGATNVWLFVGVNGVGKTTSIGKVALRHVSEGQQVVMAAADTFRAAAAEQLELWARRVGADLVRGAEGGDPGSVVFDAVQRAASRGADLVLADTAGRLHTKVNLMEELKKVRRVAEREPGRVTEVLLVLDATTGQNGLTQAREFTGAVGVTGVVLTKLDGTAKGGIVLAIQHDLGLPVKLVGVGEAAEDLVDFDPDEFVEALFD
ncbi:MAG TPA: signal recognition particle-docking protein FtsY [Acidimicrobiales bacterium]|nr:signal recognition particle-docking protein FtsY [Acidimicrobiales bacterium]